MTHPSAGDMIAKYQEIKAYIDAEQGKFDEAMKPFKNALNTLRVACGVALQEQNLQNFKTDDGTAYLRHDKGIKVDNQPDFLNFVRVNERWDMVSVGAVKDQVEEYADKNDGQPPPGVTFNPSITCIIRK